MYVVIFAVKEMLVAIAQKKSDCSSFADCVNGYCFVPRGYGGLCQTNSDCASQMCNFTMINGTIIGNGTCYGLSPGADCNAISNPCEPGYYCPIETKICQPYIKFNESCKYSDSCEPGNFCDQNMIGVGVCRRAYSGGEGSACSGFVGACQISLVCQNEVCTSVPDDYPCLNNTDRTANSERCPFGRTCGCSSSSSTPICIGHIAKGDCQSKLDALVTCTINNNITMWYSNQFPPNDPNANSYSTHCASEYISFTCSSDCPDQMSLGRMYVDCDTKQFRPPTITSSLKCDACISQSNPSGDNGSKSNTTIIIAIAVPVGLLCLGTIIYCMCRKKDNPTEGQGPLLASGTKQTYT